MDRLDVKRHVNNSREFPKQQEAGLEPRKHVAPPAALAERLRNMLRLTN